MKRNVWKKNVKRILALTMMACMLLTWSKVVGDAGIRPCGEMIEEIIRL